MAVKLSIELFAFKLLVESMNVKLSIELFALKLLGGAHKVITGSFSFFNQSIEKNIGALNFHRQSTKCNYYLDIICVFVFT